VITSLMMALTLVTSADDDSPGRDAAYWRAIVEKGTAVPDGEDPFELVVDLFGNLGSPDPVLRDDYGYGITANLVYRQRLFGAEQSAALIEHLLANLRVGIGERGTDSVLLRSFSALDLSIFAALDLEAPFLDQARFDRLLDGTLAYLAEEKDVRGRHPEQGWLHSVAHSADVLKFLARSPRLEADGQERIFLGIAGKLSGTGEFLTHGEDERLARVLLSLIARDDFKVDQLERFIETLRHARAPLPGATAFDAGRFAARQNGVALLRVLFVYTSHEQEPSDPALTARDLLLRTLERF